MKTIIISVLVVMLPSIMCNTTKRNDAAMNEILSGIQKAAPNSKIVYFDESDIRKKKVVKYLIIHSGVVLTEQEREAVRQEATRLEHKFNIPIYEVQRVSEANTKIKVP